MATMWKLISEDPESLYVLTLPDFTVACAEGTAHLHCALSRQDQDDSPYGTTSPKTSGGSVDEPNLG